MSWPFLGGTSVNVHLGSRRDLVSLGMLVPSFTPRTLPTYRTVLEPHGHASRIFCDAEWHSQRCDPAFLLVTSFRDFARWKAILAHSPNSYLQCGLSVAVMLLYTSCHFWTFARSGSPRANLAVIDSSPLELGFVWSDPSKNSFCSDARLRMSWMASIHVHELLRSRSGSMPKTCSTLSGVPSLRLAEPCSQSC